jgi:hypothetical protein
VRVINSPSSHATWRRSTFHRQPAEGLPRDRDRILLDAAERRRDRFHASDLSRRG